METRSQMYEKATHGYVGRHPICGHIRAAVIDGPGEEKETAKCVAEFIGEGMRIERMTCEEIRAKFATDRCDVCDPKRAEQLTLGSI